MSRKKWVKRGILVALIVITILIIWCIFFPLIAFNPICDCVPFCCWLNEVVYTWLGWEPVCDLGGVSGISDEEYQICHWDSSLGICTGLCAIGLECEFTKLGCECIAEEEEELDEECRWELLGCIGACDLGLECLPSGLFSCSCLELAEEEEEDIVVTNCDSFCMTEGYEHGSWPRDAEDFDACVDSGGFIASWLDEGRDCCCINPAGGREVDEIIGGESVWCWDTDGGVDWEVAGVCMDNYGVTAMFEDYCFVTDEGTMLLREYVCVDDYIIETVLGISEVYYGRCRGAHNVPCPACLDGVCNEDAEVTLCADSDYPACGGYCPPLEGYTESCQGIIWEEWGIEMTGCECRYSSGVPGEFDDCNAICDSFGYDIGTAIYTEVDLGFCLDMGGSITAWMVPLDPPESCCCLDATAGEYNVGEGWCYDSDGGYFDLYGVCVNDWSFYYPDECVGDTLYEKKCGPDGMCSVEVYDCFFGCSGGACESGVE